MSRRILLLLLLPPPPSAAAMSRRILRILLPPPPSAAAAAADGGGFHLDRVLAAVFFVTLAYIFISSLCHCLHRRHLHGSDQNPNINADPACSAQLREIPLATVRRNAAPTAPSDADVQEGEVEVEEESLCAVCLGAYNEGEEIRTMPRCRHVFHRECIDRWLIQRSSFCPVCRDRVIQRAAEPR